MRSRLCEPSYDYRLVLNTLRFLWTPVAFTSTSLGGPPATRHPACSFRSKRVRPLIKKIQRVPHRNFFPKNFPAMKKNLKLFSKLFSAPKIIFKKLFRKISQKISRPGHNKTRHRNPHHSRRNPLQNPLFPDPHHPQSSPYTRPDSRKYPNGALYAPGLGSANPLFGAKLLEVFHKHGVRMIFSRRQTTNC